MMGDYCPGNIGKLSLLARAIHLQITAVRSAYPSLSRTAEPFPFRGKSGLINNPVKSGRIIIRIDRDTEGISAVSPVRVIMFGTVLDTG